MKRTIAMADNCIDVYYKQDRFYTTGNSIDFAFNYRALGGEITEMTILGNDFFADALREKCSERGIPLRVIKQSDKPTGMAKMAIVDGDRVHLSFVGNAMEEIELSEEDQAFVRDFDIVYCERWCKVHRYLPALKRPGQIWVYDFSKRLTLETNDLVLPYIDYPCTSNDTAWRKSSSRSLLVLAEKMGIPAESPPIQKSFSRDVLYHSWHHIKNILTICTFCKRLSP